MQRRGDKSAGQAAGRQRAHIINAAHTARRIEPTRAGDPADRSETRDVRSAPGPDAAQGHGDQPVGPGAGRGVKRRRADELVSAIIERQHAPVRTEMPDRGGERLRLVPAFGPEHRHGAEFGRHGRGLEAGKPAIDPDLEVAMPRREAGDQGPMAAPPFNGIEIGDIHATERREREKTVEDGVRVAAVRQERADWGILVAGAGAGMNHMAGFQVEDGNDLERNHRKGPAVRIFVWEYVTAGGWRECAASRSLIAEGAAMLKALVRDLARVSGVEVTIAGDPELTLGELPARLVSVDGRRLWDSWEEVIRSVDAVWPIAPETDGLLERATQLAHKHDRPVFNSRPDALAIARSKQATARHLAGRGVRAVAGEPIGSGHVPASSAGWVVKPDDGAGSMDTYFAADHAALGRWRERLAGRNFIVQPFVPGAPLSLSMLAQDGVAWLLACNTQHMDCKDGAFEYGGGTVGGAETRRHALEPLASGIAAALPGLWGYVGVDLIDGPNGPAVLDINPRLTTSYTALGDSLGVNPAELVLALRTTKLARLRRPLTPQPIDVQVSVAP